MSEDVPSITRLPSRGDREYFRVDGELYMTFDVVDPMTNRSPEAIDLFVPPFVQAEDDIVGLSIDAMRQQIAMESPKRDEIFFRIQQLFALLKRFADAGLRGQGAKLFKRLKVNISGSGLAFPSDVAYHGGQLLRVHLFFPVYPYIYRSVLADVIRSEKIEIGYEIKVQYHDIAEETRQDIIKFVNECQREQLKK